MSERERAALSLAIRATVQRDGHYGAVVHGSGVPQPVVSLALHRRLVMRTEKVERLFEYLRPPPDGEPATEVQARRIERVGKILDLVDGLGGSQASDENISALFAALSNLFRPDESAWDSAVNVGKRD
jgi:hypothetical protein